MGLALRVPDLFGWWLNPDEGAGGARSSSDGMLVHFEWGTRDVIVIPTRDFTVLPDQVGFPNHLYTVAQRAAVDFPSIGLPDADSVQVLAGGWRSLGMADLAEMARATESLGSTLSVPGLIAVELDMAAYVMALLGGMWVTRDMVMGMSGMGIGMGQPHSGPEWLYPNNMYGLAFAFTTGT